MATDDEVKLQMLDDEIEKEDAAGAWYSRILPRYTSTGSLVIPEGYGDDLGSATMEGDFGEGGPAEDYLGKPHNLYFDDGVRRIDFVLAWEVPEKEDEDSKKAADARAVFEKNLVEEGLNLEYDTSDPEVQFVKVHAPFEVLTRYAEILKMKMPMKQTLIASSIQKKYSKWENPVRALSSRLWETIKLLFMKLKGPFQLDQNLVPKIKKKSTLVYSREREYLFEIPENKGEFFTNAERSRIVDFILRRKPFGEDKNQAYTFGINKMLNDDYYVAAYPLHEGHWKAGSAENKRKMLYDNWAHYTKFFKLQPIDQVRHYYGEKIGMYFAWLGFYTQMLVPASIMGVIIFIYGLAIMNNSYPALEICDESLNFTMCPLCDYQCPYWQLSDACSHATTSRLFDNNGTVFFAIFMSFWGTLFLEFWKRKQAVIQYKWDLTDFVQEEEPPRPEFLAKLAQWPRQKVNPITGMTEPHLPFWRRRFPIFMLSYSVMFFMMALAIGGVVGVIAYRVSTLAALSLLEKEEVPTNTTLGQTTTVIYENASLITTVTAACINVVIIIILNFIYNRIAVWLTDFECLRTQSEYDNSINIKLFSLQFVNYFSSIIYIAFFKGRLVGRPGDYNMAFGARQEECGAGGCLIELCIQLAIIMAGKQLIQNNLIEIVLPKLIKLAKRLWRKKIKKETAQQKAALSSWVKDYRLQEADSSLFHEYLEMVLQFGFLTIFVAAFPLGPLCCLINNCVEIRFDALKLTTDLRRPMADRAADIGIWFSLLYAISRLAIVSNGFIISLTSDFIPRLVYTYSYSPDGSLVGYTNHSLSWFNTSDFEPDKKPKFDQDVDMCRYRDYRNPPWIDEENMVKYDYSEAYWHVLAARFAFVVVFENVVVVVTSLIAWLIPDVPSKVKKDIRREAYMSNEIVIKTELMKARGENVGANLLGNILSKMRKPGAAGNSELTHRATNGSHGRGDDAKPGDASDV